MKWNEVKAEHDGKKVSVSAKSTPKNPLNVDGPYVGTISCSTDGAIPYLHIGDMVYCFAWYYNVEFI